MQHADETVVREMQAALGALNVVCLRKGEHWQPRACPRKWEHQQPCAQHWSLLSWFPEELIQMLIVSFWEVKNTPSSSEEKLTHALSS